jgi:hypothetical protein
MSDIRSAIITGEVSTEASQLLDEKLRKNRERVALHAARNPEKVREQNRQSKKRQREKNPEKFAERYRSWRNKNAEALKWYEVSRKFGITQQEYENLFTAQNGVCAICGNPETVTRNGVLRALAVDHCHDTGRIRGLLCSSCNLGLGKFKDDKFLLKKAVEYLSNPKEGLVI